MVAEMHAVTINEDDNLPEIHREMIRDGFCAIVDSFIEEAEAALAGGARYELVFDVAENPVIRLLSELAGYQPCWFALLFDEGKYCYFDLDKVRMVKKEILETQF